jgi:hypothetical protein
MTTTHSRPLRHRLAILGLITAAAAIGVSPPAASAGGTPIVVRRCSTSGLEFSYAAGGATFGVKVTSLAASGVGCSAARTLAGRVAMDLLHDRKPPARIAGLAVAVRRPCAGCAPHYTGTATGARKRLVFAIAGGA